MKRKLENAKYQMPNIKLLETILLVLSLVLASSVVFAGDPEPDFYELRVKPVSQLPEFWDNEDGTYTSPSEGHLHTIIYAGNSTSSALSVNGNVVTVESGWDWGADVNGVWFMAQASTFEGGKRGRCYAHYVSWSGGQLAEFLAMIDSTLEWKVLRDDFFAADRITQGILRIPELGGAWHSQYSSIRRENFIKWTDWVKNCRSNVLGGSKENVLERALRAYPGDETFTRYLQVIQGVEGNDCGGVTSTNLGLFPQTVPTATPRSPTATRLPPSPTPVPTATKRPLATATPMVAVSSSESMPPPVAARGKLVFEELVITFAKICIALIVFAALLTTWWWGRQARARSKQEEEAKREEQLEEARKRFDKYVAEAESALKQGELNTARNAIRKADALSRAHPQGADIVLQLNVQLKQKELEK